MHTNDGGPAFPRTADAIAHENRQFDLDGMSLRDFFAGMALQGILANATLSCGPWVEFDLPDAVEATAHAAYQMADAMCAARLPNVPTEAST